MDDTVLIEFVKLKAETNIKFFSLQVVQFKYAEKIQVDYN